MMNQNSDLERSKECVEEVKNPHEAFRDHCEEARIWSVHVAKTHLKVEETVRVRRQEWLHVGTTTRSSSERWIFRPIEGVFSPRLDAEFSLYGCF